MAAKEFNKATLQELRRIQRLRGITAFCEKTGISPKTFNPMVKSGSARKDVVEKVEKAIHGGENIHKKPTADVVETIVCVSYAITREALHNERSPMNIEARQVTYLLMNEEAKTSKAAIAKHFNFRDHTNITHNIKTIRGRLSVENELQDRVNRIREKIQAAA